MNRDRDALVTAVENGDLRLVETLLKCSADPNQLDSLGFHALYLSANIHNLEVRMMIDDDE